jgi:hypothetical protein
VLVPCLQATLEIPGVILAHADAVFQHTILVRSGLGSKPADQADTESSVVVQPARAHTK